MTRRRSLVQSAIAITLCWSMAAGRVASADGTNSRAVNGGGGIRNEGNAPGAAATSSGAATTSVQFVLPPARGAAQPSLSLQYSSHAGDGEAGLGWALTGTPSIERTRSPFGYIPMEFADRSVPYSFPQSTRPTPASGQPVAAQGAPLTAAEADRYQWSGRALVLVCASVANCSTGESFDASLRGAAYYRLQSDSVFARFFRFGETHWIVQYKSGLTETYGEYQPGASAATEHDRVAPYEPAVRWRLSRTADPHGNAIFYVWSNGRSLPSNPPSGLSYLTDIYYTTPVAEVTDGEPSFDPWINYEHHVTLTWELPDYAQQSYAPVWMARREFRLARVDVASVPWLALDAMEEIALWKAPAAPRSARQMVRRYQLTYYPHAEAAGGGLDPYVAGVHAPLDGHSFLKTVQMQGRCNTPTEEISSRAGMRPLLPEVTACDDDPTRWLPASRFEYTPRGRSVAYAHEVLPLAASPTLIQRPERTAIVDVNRDGWPDIAEGWWSVFRNVGDYKPNPQTTPVRFVEDCASAIDPGGPVPDESYDTFSSYFRFHSRWSSLFTEYGGLSVAGPWEHYGQGVPVFWRQNLYPQGYRFALRNEPDWTWNSASIQEAGYCGSGSGQLARRSWQYLPNEDQRGPFAPLAPSTYRTTGSAYDSQLQGDNIYDVGDVDGDGLPDGYVRAQNSIDGSDTIRFSRRSRSHGAQHVSVMSERVRTNASIDAHDCRYPSGLEATFFNGDPSIVAADTLAINACVYASMRASVHGLLDMNGDGLADIVKSTPLVYAVAHDFSKQGGSKAAVYPSFAQNVLLDYTPGNGRGWFGSDATRHLPEPTSPDLGLKLYERILCRPGPLACPAPPKPDQFIFGDLNADGFTDLVIPKEEFSSVGIVKRLRLNIYLNHGGTMMFDRREYVEARIGFGTNYKVVIADLNGSGVDDIVVIAQDGIYSIDLQGGTKPGLLSRVDNGLGAQQTFQYSTYQRLLEDEREFDPSVDDEANKLPVVVHLVATVTNTNKISVTPGGFTSQTHYHYRKPAWDRWAGALAGFGEVTVSVDGGATTQDVYLFGSCESRRGCADTSDDNRDSILGGNVVSSTVLGGDPLRWNRPPPVLKQIIYNYEAVMLGVGADGRHRWSVNISNTETHLFAGDSPGIAVAGTEPVLRFPNGNAMSTRLVPITRWHSTESALLYQEYQYDADGNLTVEINHGRVGDDLTPIDKDVITTTYVPELRGDWMWRTAQVTIGVRPAPTDPNEATVVTEDVPDRRVTYHYNRTGDLLWTEAYLEGTVPLERSHPDGAFAKELEGSQDGWVRQQTNTYDRFGNLLTSIGPEVNAVTRETGDLKRLAGCTRTEYDRDYAHYPVMQAVPLDGDLDGGCSSKHLLETRKTYDRGFGVVTNEISPYATIVSREYDAFGRIRRIRGPDADVPGVFVVLPLVTVRYTDGEPYSRAEVGTLYDNGRGRLSYQTTVQFYDGYGRTLLTLSPDLQKGSWIATGLASRNPLGLPVSVYSAFSYTGSTEILDLAPPAATPVTRYDYDAYGRVINVYDGSELASSKQYGPLRSTVWDAEGLGLGTGRHYGTSTSMHYDGHARPYWISKTLSSGAEEITSFGYLPTGETVRETRRLGQAIGTSTTRTRKFDTLGRMVLQSEPNTTRGGHVWRYQYNDAGALIGSSDARGCGANYYYDGAGRPVAEDDSPCLSSQTPYTKPDLATGDGTEIFNRYDEAEIGEPIEHLGRTTSLLGRLVSTQDQGAHTRYAYDLKGQPVALSRRVVKPGVADERLAERYADHWYQTQQRFNEQGRVVAQTTGADVPELMGPDGKSEIRFFYGVRGVEEVDSSYGPIVASMQLTIDGLPSRIAYGNAVTPTAISTMSYENRARRLLTESKVERGVTQHVLFWNAVTYDAVGNPLTIEDLRPRDSLPDGAKPMSKTLEYDDNYRVTHVEYRSEQDIRVSPFAREVAFGDTRAVPLAARPLRVQEQTFEYDYLGNITNSWSDDAQAFWDRHLRTQNHGEESYGPHQLTSAVGIAASEEDPASIVQQGALRVHYDESGNMVDLVVHRPGVSCDGDAACNQRYQYEWGPTGLLARARRWDIGVVTEETPIYPAPPSGEPAWELSYAYDASGQRILKTSTASGGEPLHTLEIFESLRVNRTPFIDGDYERTADTEAIYLAAGARVVYGAYETGDEGEAVDPTPGPRMFIEMGDLLGSTSIVLDQQTRDLVEATTYDVNGSTESDYRPGQWKSFREDYRFTGKEEDVEVGLTYFGARYLQSNLRRWISADPLTIHGWGADSNPYAYVEGRTTTAVDPNGLDVAGSAQGPNGVAHGGMSLNSGGRLPAHMRDGGISLGVHAAGRSAGAARGGGGVITIPTVTIIGKVPEPPPIPDEVDVASNASPPMEISPTGASSSGAGASTAAAQSSFTFTPVAQQMLEAQLANTLKPNKVESGSSMLSFTSAAEAATGELSYRGPAGYNFVGAHASPRGFFPSGARDTSTPVSYKEMARVTFSAIGYQPSLPVVLLSCGTSPEGLLEFAAELERLGGTGIVIAAPGGKVHFQTAGPTAGASPVAHTPFQRFVGPRTHPAASITMPRAGYHPMPQILHDFLGEAR